jgi:hypothetical protein
MAEDLSLGLSPTEANIAFFRRQDAAENISEKVETLRVRADVLLDQMVAAVSAARIAEFDDVLSLVREGEKRARSAFAILGSVWIPMDAARSYEAKYASAARIAKSLHSPIAGIRLNRCSEAYSSVLRFRTYALETLEEYRRCHADDYTDDLTTLLIATTFEPAYAESRNPSVTASLHGPDCFVELRFRIGNDGLQEGHWSLGKVGVPVSIWRSPGTFWKLGTPKADFDVTKLADAIATVGVGRIRPDVVAAYLWAFRVDTPQLQNWIASALWVKADRPDAARDPK